jgi:POT family proton-dependent oligopeptide transporter
MLTIINLAGVLITLVTGIPVMLQLFKTHPRGLFVLFFAEMWERFSYYGMRGIYVLYLTQHFLFDDKFANSQYGAYTSLVYLVPLVGGFLADKYLGTRKAVAFGAVLLVIGQLGMALHAGPSKQYIDYTSPTGAHARYEVQVPDGKKGKVPLLTVAGKGYEMSASKAGDLQIKGLPADAAVPATLPASSFKKVTDQEPLFVGLMYLALGFIIMGVGFLKANISAIVGQLYTQGDPRRDPGFTLYYYGVNLGAFWSAILCSWLGQKYGWEYGFGLAGLGMLAGFIVFVLGKPLLQGKGEPPSMERLKQKVFGGLSRETFIYMIGLAGVAVVWGLLRADGLARDWIGHAMDVAKAHGGTASFGLNIAAFFAVIGSLLLAASVGVIGYLVWFMGAKCTKIERERLMLAMVLLAGCVVFFALFEQAGSSLNLFADRNTDLTLIAAPIMFSIGGHEIMLSSAAQLAAAHLDAHKVIWIDSEITTGQTQSFNAGFILIFAPIFAALWTWLGRIGKDPGPLVKFGLGLIQLGGGFLFLVWGSQFHDAAFRLPIVFLAGAYLLHTTGELFLSPVGLSEITKLAPLSIISTMLAVWFLATAWGQWVAAAIAATTSSETVGGQVLDPSKGLAQYVSTFQIIGIAGVIAGGIFLVLSPILKHWGHGVNDPQANASGLTDRGQEL